MPAHLGMARGRQPSYLPPMGVDLPYTEAQRAPVPSAGPFHLLGIEPSATHNAIREAYSRIRSSGTIDGSVLEQALAELLDPEKRLECELAYPLDATPGQIEAIHAMSDGAHDDQRVLDFARQLPALSRANFLA